MLYSIIIALFPILHYMKTPFISMGLSTFVTLILFPLAVMSGLLNGNMSGRKMRPLLPYLLYIILQFLVLFITEKQGNSDAWKGIMLLLFNTITCLCLLAPKFDLPAARKTVETVSVIAVIWIAFQVVMKELFGMELLRLPRSMVYLDRAESMIEQTTGLFRPSAFFNEPAQFAQYVVIGQASVLFRDSGEKVQIRKALLYSVGILLSTSGIGIVLCAFLWAMFLYMRKREDSRGKSTPRILYLLIAVILLAFLAVVLYQTVPVFRGVIDRILGTSGYDPISGRTWSYVLYERLPNTQKLWGIGYANTSGWYMTSLVESLYYVGVIGTVLLLYALFRYFILTKGNAFERMVLLVVVALLPVAHTFTFSGIAFYFSFIICGIAKQKAAVPDKNSPSPIKPNQRQAGFQR